MICRDAQTWLLTDGPTGPAPHGLRDHLRSCGKCRHLYRRVTRLEREVQAIPAPPPPAAVRAAILARIAQPLEVTRNGTPTGPVPVLEGPRPRRRASWLRFGIATAAAALIAVVSYWASRPSPVPPVVDPGAGHALADEDVLARVMRHHLKLAEGLPPAERLQVLAGMAAELRGESLRQAQGAKAADVALLTRLARMYTQVLNDGVLARANRLPAEQRREVLRPLADELRRAAGETERLALQTAPEAAQPLRGLADAARAAHERLDRLLTEGAS